jgi:hypothetical protein
MNGKINHHITIYRLCSCLYYEQFFALYSALDSRQVPTSLLLKLSYYLAMFGALSLGSFSLLTFPFLIPLPPISLIIMLIIQGVKQYVVQEAQNPRENNQNSPVRSHGRAKGNTLEVK